MSNPLVLDFDPTGQSQNNRISGEMHLLNAASGRVFALNYGGFYTSNLVIRDPVTNTTLTPVVDYVVLGPYDNITKQTGLEAACVIAITTNNWQREWEVSYNAVGGEYSTNVQAIRDIITLNQVDVGSVRWGDIVNKPVSFNTAPHLYDFRKDMFGFEGLIEAVDRVSERMAALSPAETAIVLSSVNDALNKLSVSVQNSISAIQAQVDGISVPDVSGFMTGKFANLEDINSGVDVNSAVPASMLDRVAKRAASGRQLPSGTPGSVLDTIDEPVVTGTFNLRSFGDHTVPNQSLTYVVNTYWTTKNVINPSVVSGYQTATSISGTGNLLGVFLYRVRNNGAPPSPWKRIDVNRYTMLNDYGVSSSPAERAWASPSNEVYMTPLQTKNFMQENSDYIVPVGTIVAFAGQSKDWTLTNYRLCQGQLMSKASFSQLAAVLGNTYGGNETSFRLPDLRGVVIRGFDDDRGLDPGRVFGSYQADQNKLHGHTYCTSGGNGDTDFNGGMAMENNTNYVNVHPEYTGTPTNQMDKIIGGSGGSEARMKNVAMHFIIRVR